MEISENPRRRVSLLKGEQHRTRYLFPEEEERLTVVLTGRRARLRDVVELFINSGLRLMELLSLTVELIDSHRDVVHVKNAKGYVA